MALIKCPACGKDVSEEAAACPHCGHPINSEEAVSAKTAKGKSRHGCLTAVGVIFLIGIVAAAIGNLSPSQQQSSGPQGSGCSSDWTKCIDNADLVNHYRDWTRVQVDCKDAAEKQARYGTPKWPWLAFGKFLRGDDYMKKGVAIAVEDDAQFQNGFGAMVHSMVTCTYDLRANRVLNVAIIAR